jgi:hypothetical protein
VQWREIPFVYATLCAIEGMPAKALRMLIVCGAPRAHEVFGMSSHYRTKRWPSSTATAPTGRPLISCSPAARQGRINHQAMRLLLRELGSEYDVHGFRKTLKSFCLDNLKHVLDEPAVELAHDHAIGGKVAETYRGTGLVRHRRILNERYVALLTAWPTPAPTRCLLLVVDNVAAA